MYLCVCGGGGGGGGREGGGLKLPFTGSQPSLSASIAVKIYIFVRSVWRSSNSSINHYGQ